SFQGTQNHGGALSAVLTVPSAQERNGDFTDQSKALKDPVNPITNQPMTDAAGALCIQDNIVRSTCITKMAQSLLPLIPQSASVKLTTIGPQPQTHNMGLLRLDWNPSTKHTLSGHLNIDNNLLQRLNLVGGSIPNYMSGYLAERTTMVTLN